MCKCVYCGEEEATITIPNPNFDEDELFWEVCKDCREVLYYQQRSVMAEIFKDTKMMEECNNKLIEISERIKKPIIRAEISLTKEGYKSNSIIYGDE